ncbi:hypothetical protein ACS6GG_09810 [Enterobacter bugandensis]|uniref:hypothetical protein n=1 Tax=Enterobacter bugandensis TaxID=881260 RepID=UPI003F425620
MEAMTRVTRIILVLLIILFLSATAYLIYTRQQTPGLEVNCSTVIHYDNMAPVFVSSLELHFRLHDNHTGRAVLSGNIDDGNNITLISRSIVFDYEISAPGEISVSNLRYLKNTRDTASDDYFRNSFFYAREGTNRLLRLSPLNNGWLLGNLQSSFAICVNKQA